MTSSRLIGPLLLSLCTAFSPIAHAQLHTDPVYDRLIKRTGPERDEAFAKGELGIVLPTYHREPLYEAYRAFALGREALQREKQEPTASASPDEKNAIDKWLAARLAVAGTPPKHLPGLYSRQAVDTLASFVNCTPGAYALAVQTLGELRQQGRSPAELSQWVDGQDAVFGFCQETESAEADDDAETAALMKQLRPNGATAKKREAARPPPQLPSPLPTHAPELLRQLRQYQIAAAHFYAGQYPQARAAFEAIGTQPGHPMRQWAALASLRASLREATLASEYHRRWREIGQQKLSEKERGAARQQAARESNSRKLAAMTDIATRAKALLANPEYTPIHPALLAHVKQAMAQLDPWARYRWLGDELAELQRNPYADRTLSQWADLGDRLLDFPPPGPDLSALRKRWAYFDWIRTLQGCTDNPASPNHTGRCEQEQQHAIDQWTLQREPVWLLAVMVTAPQLTPANDAAVMAALNTPRDALAATSLRYHAARLLRKAGKTEQARRVVDEVLATKLFEVSSINLFKQERLALASTLDDTAPYLLRLVPGSSNQWGPSLGADGDELLNRRLGVADLLNLAAAPNAPATLKRQLWVAAWFRADLLGQFELADKAASALLPLPTTSPELRSQIEAYVAGREPQQKHDALLMVVLTRQVSPQLFQGPHARLGQLRRANEGIKLWCSFKAADFAEQLRIERAPPLPELSAAPAARDTEITRLQALGSGDDWLAAQALAFAKRRSDAPNEARALLQAVLRNASASDCPSPQAEAHRRAAQAAQAALGTLPR